MAWAMPGRLGTRLGSSPVERGSPPLQISVGRCKSGSRSSRQHPSLLLRRQSHQHTAARWSLLRSSASSDAVPAGSSGGGGFVGGSGSGGAGGSRGGGGGGDGRDDASGGSGSGDSFLLKGWRDRVLEDPSFPFKVLVEQIIGVGAAVLGDMSSRPNWGLYELDFVFSTLVVGSIVNFSLMYMLAKTPAQAMGAGSSNPLKALFDTNTLKRMGAPGGSFFEPGFPLGKRFVNLAVKGLIFGIVGFGAGIAGTAVSNGLLAVRKRLDANFELQNKPPNVLLNAGCWGTHMAVSSNVRYQLLNGLDMAVQPVLPPWLFKILSTAIRLLNNVVGGVSFVTLAKMLKVQESSPSSAARIDL